MPFQLTEDDLAYYASRVDMRTTAAALLHYVHDRPVRVLRIGEITQRGDYWSRTDDSFVPDTAIGEPQQEMYRPAIRYQEEL